MAVVVDRKKCIGCGVCEATCPDGFEIKGGKSFVKNSNAKCIDDAISACPVSAIRRVKK